MTCSCVVWMRAMGVGHVTRRDAERVRDETSGIGPGSSGRRDRVGTGRGMSHNRLAEQKTLSGLVQFFVDMTSMVGRPFGNVISMLWSATISNNLFESASAAVVKRW